VSGPGGSASRAYGMSNDGVVVGWAYYCSDPACRRASRWSVASGWQNLGAFPGGVQSEAWGVSPDGSSVVGHTRIPRSSRAFRWTSAAGMQNLGTLAGHGSDYWAWGVSNQGSVVVGNGFIWTPSDRMMEPGVFLAARGVDLTGWSNISATDV